MRRALIPFDDIGELDYPYVMSSPLGTDVSALLRGTNLG